jgi:hypothetical protein
LPVDQNQAASGKAGIGIITALVFVMLKVRATEERDVATTGRETF